MVAIGLAALPIAVALGGFAMFRGKAEAGNLMFVIPAGAAPTLERLTIDLAIEIPTDIRFSPSKGGRIAADRDPGRGQHGKPVWADLHPALSQSWHVPVRLRC